MNKLSDNNDTVSNNILHKKSYQDKEVKLNYNENLKIGSAHRRQLESKYNEKVLNYNNKEKNLKFIFKHPTSEIEKILFKYYTVENTDKNIKKNYSLNTPKKPVEIIWDFVKYSKLKLLELQKKSTFRELRLRLPAQDKKYNTNSLDSIKKSKPKNFLTEYKNSFKTLENLVKNSLEPKNNDTLNVIGNKEIIKDEINSLLNKSETKENQETLNTSSIKNKDLSKTNNLNNKKLVKFSRNNKFSQQRKSDPKHIHKKWKKLEKEINKFKSLNSYNVKDLMFKNSVHSSSFKVIPKESTLNYIPYFDNFFYNTPNLYLNVDNNFNNNNKLYKTLEIQSGELVSSKFKNKNIPINNYLQFSDFNLFSDFDIQRALPLLRNIINYNPLIKQVYTNELNFKNKEEYIENYIKNEYFEKNSFFLNQVLLNNNLPALQDFPVAELADKQVLFINNIKYNLVSNFIVNFWFNKIFKYNQKIYHTYYKDDFKLNSNTNFLPYTWNSFLNYYLSLNFELFSNSQHSQLSQISQMSQIFIDISQVKLPNIKEYSNVKKGTVSKFVKPFEKIISPEIQDGQAGTEILNTKDNNYKNEEKVILENIVPVLSNTNYSNVKNQEVSKDLDLQELEVQENNYSVSKTLETINNIYCSILHTIKTENKCSSKTTILSKSNSSLNSLSFENKLQLENYSKNYKKTEDLSELAFKNLYTLPIENEIPYKKAKFKDIQLPTHPSLHFYEKNVNITTLATRGIEVNKENKLNPISLNNKDLKKIGIGALLSRIESNNLSLDNLHKVKHTKFKKFNMESNGFSLTEQFNALSNYLNTSYSSQALKKRFINPQIKNKLIVKEMLNRFIYLFKYNPKYRTIILNYLKYNINKNLKYQFNRLNSNYFKYSSYNRVTSANSIVQIVNKLNNNIMNGKSIEILIFRSKLNLKLISYFKEMIYHLFSNSVTLLKLSKSNNINNQEIYKQLDFKVSQSLNIFLKNNINLSNLSKIVESLKDFSDRSDKVEVDSKFDKYKYKEKDAIKPNMIPQSIEKIVKNLLTPIGIDLEIVLNNLQKLEEYITFNLKAYEDHILYTIEKKDIKSKEIKFKGKRVENLFKLNSNTKIENTQNLLKKNIFNNKVNFINLYFSELNSPTTDNTVSVANAVTEREYKKYLDFNIKIKMIHKYLLNIIPKYFRLFSVLSKNSNNIYNLVNNITNLDSNIQEPLMNNVIKQIGLLNKDDNNDNKKHKNISTVNLNSEKFNRDIDQKDAFLKVYKNDLMFSIWMSSHIYNTKELLKEELINKINRSELISNIKLKYLNILNDLKEPRVTLAKVENNKESLHSLHSLQDNDKLKKNIDIINNNTLLSKEVKLNQEINKNITQMENTLESETYNPELFPFRHRKQSVSVLGLRRYLFRYNQMSDIGHSQSITFNFIKNLKRLNTLDSMDHTGSLIRYDISVLLKYFFKIIGGALISKPVFIFTNKTLIIKLFFYIRKNIYFLNNKDKNKLQYLLLKNTQLITPKLLSKYFVSSSSGLNSPYKFNHKAGAQIGWTYLKNKFISNNFGFGLPSSKFNTIKDKNLKPIISGTKVTGGIDRIKELNEKNKMNALHGNLYLTKFDNRLAKFKTYNKHTLRTRVRRLYPNYFKKYLGLFNNNILSIFKKEFNALTLILENFFNCSIQLELTKINYPYFDSNILSQIIGLNGKFYNFERIIKLLYRKVLIRNPNTTRKEIDLSPKSKKSLVSYLSGIKIRVAGRFYKHKIIPRKTVSTIQRGSLARGVVKFVESSRFINKSKRGSFSVTVNISHIY